MKNINLQGYKNITPGQLITRLAGQVTTWQQRSKKKQSQIQQLRTQVRDVKRSQTKYKQRALELRKRLKELEQQVAQLSASKANTEQSP